MKLREADDPTVPRLLQVLPPPPSRRRKRRLLGSVGPNHRPRFPGGDRRAPRPAVRGPAPALVGRSRRVGAAPAARRFSPRRRVPGGEEPAGRDGGGRLAKPFTLPPLSRRPSPPNHLRLALSSRPGSRTSTDWRSSTRGAAERKAPTRPSWPSSKASALRRAVGQVAGAEAF